MIFPAENEYGGSNIYASQVRSHSSSTKEYSVPLSAQMEI